MSKHTGEPQSWLDNVHLQWFAAGDPQTTDGAEPQAGDQTGVGEDTGKEKPTGEARAESSDQSSAPEAKAEGTVSKKDFETIKAELEHLKTVHGEMKAKEKQKQEAEQKKRGEFETLYNTANTELEAVKPERDKYKQAVEGMLESEVKALPETFDQTLIPEGDPVEKLAWIRKAKAAGLLGQRKPQGDGSVPFGNTQDTGAWASLYEKTTPA